MVIKIYGEHGRHQVTMYGYNALNYDPSAKTLYIKYGPQEFTFTSVALAELTATKVTLTALAGAGSGTGSAPELVTIFFKYA
jgi:hypothetical protein